MKPYLLIILILVFCGVGFGQKARDYGRGWISYAAAGDSIFLYNKLTLMKTPDTIRFWTKRIEKGTSDYDMGLMEINCAEHSYRTVSLDYYNGDGAVLNIVEVPKDAEFNPIIPIMRKLEIMVCKQRK